MKLNKYTSADVQTSYKAKPDAVQGIQSMDFGFSSMQQRSLNPKESIYTIDNISPFEDAKFVAFKQEDPKSRDTDPGPTSPQIRITQILEKRGYKPADSKLGKKITEQYTGTINFATTRREGQGVYTFSNPYFQYQGEYFDGKKHGNGVLKLQNGTFIEGTFENDEFVGQAHVVYGNGDTYTGGFENGEKNGEGDFTSPMLTYKGEWLNNTQHGRGRLEDKIKRQVVEGQFWGNKPHGDCKLMTLDGKLIYHGHMEHGKRQGKGIGEGELWNYKGLWNDDLWDGPGELSLKDRPWAHKGMFKQGARVVIPNKLIFNGFTEQWIDPEALNTDPKKDPKNKKGQLNKDSTKESVKERSPDATPSPNPRGHNFKDTLQNSFEPLEVPEKPLIRQIDLIPDGELKVQAGAKEGINLLLKIVYQGPDYPDPNPPPPDPKKKPIKKKTDKEAPEEPEIPMLTPEPVIIEQESGRRFKLEMQSIKDDGSLGDKFKVDYRSEIKELEELSGERDELEQKVKDIKNESPKSRKHILAKKATLMMIDENSVNLYSAELHDNEKPYYKSSDQGIIEIKGLRYPENFPGGTYRFTITDQNPKMLSFVENLGSASLTVIVIAKNQVDSGPAKKKPVLAKRK